MIDTAEVRRVIGALAEIGADYSAHRNREVHEMLKDFRARANRELTVFVAHQLEGDGQRRIALTRVVLFDIYRDADDSATKLNDSSLKDVAGIAAEGLAMEELS